MLAKMVDLWRYQLSDGCMNIFAKYKNNGKYKILFEMQRFEENIKKDIIL